MEQNNLRALGAELNISLLSRLAADGLKVFVVLRMIGKKHGVNFIDLIVLLDFEIGSVTFCV